MKESYSQLNQDRNVLTFYGNKTGGFFVEIGANDGMNLSNTYLLEMGYQWKGICAEPIPSAYEKLVRNRPNSSCSDLAVYSESDLTFDFDIALNYQLLSGISHAIDCHRTTVDSNKQTIPIKTISLNDLLKKYDAPTFIEYLSVDTEGSEYEILKTIDFDTYTFGLIDVEHNYIEPRRTEIRNLLTSHGYIYIGENKWDDSYQWPQTTNNSP